MDWRKSIGNINSQLNTAYESGVEQALDRFGLEHKKNTMDVVLPALGIFSAGIVVGAALGVLFAPKRGEEVRHDLRHRLDDLRSRNGNEFDSSYDELRQQHAEGAE